jgi:phosphoenolpyruvate carboxykinase (ATP)
MQQFGLVPESASLADIGINDGIAQWNLSPEELAAIAVKLGQAVRTSSGAIAVDTGEFTGRSPRDRFIVRDGLTDKTVWWSKINIPFEAERFDRLLEKVTRYLNGKEIYVRDADVCASPDYRLNVRVITEYPWSNLFVYNMFIRPELEDLKIFSPEWLIICAPGFKAISTEDGTRQHNFSIINITRKMILIGGTAYTGEIKKGMFSALNFILPYTKNVLPMHCAANIGPKDDVAVFFGLSGTGKTTLSADPDRRLIGDDEHGWSPDNTIFNFEGGCYAKVFNLSPEEEPDIFNAISSGALLENVGFRKGSHEVDFSDGSKTENTRVSYPINHIRNSVNPSLGRNPKNIFFLTCDAFGVLPPIAKLSPGQAAFHFISGYTAKIAGTEDGIVEPLMTFSDCFGGPFMPLHPAVYAQMLSKRITENKVNVWLVNTGWTGGPYGTGKRMRLAYTRALIKAALTDKLTHVEYKQDDIFGFMVPISCPGVPAEILDARKTWSDGSAYHAEALYLAKAFIRNFRQFSSSANDEIVAGAPRVQINT